MINTHGFVAQLVEQLTLNQKVPGSRPGWCTKLTNKKIESLNIVTLFCQYHGNPFLDWFLKSILSCLI